MFLHENKARLRGMSVSAHAGARTGSSGFFSGGLAILRSIQRNIVTVNRATESALAEKCILEKTVGRDEAGFSRDLGYGHVLEEAIFELEVHVNTQKNRVRGNDIPGVYQGDGAIVAFKNSVFEAHVIKDQVGEPAGQKAGLPFQVERITLTGDQPALHGYVLQQRSFENGIDKTAVIQYHIAHDHVLPGNVHEGGVVESDILQTHAGNIAVSEAGTVKYGRIGGYFCRQITLGIGIGCIAARAGHKHGKHKADQKKGRQKTDEAGCCMCCFHTVFP